MSSPQPGCRFCLANGLLVDAPLFSNAQFYALGSIDPMVPVAAMIIPRRHSETPFDLLSDEWLGFAEILDQAKAHFAGQAPDGFTLGWNVGAVAGQHVFHTHLHIIPRFLGAPDEGVGIRRIMRSPDWAADT